MRGYRASLNRGALLALTGAMAFALACAPASPQPARDAGGAGSTSTRGATLAKDQEFRFQATEPTMLDPGLVGDFTTLQYWQLLWEGLVGRDKDNHLQARGAESYTVSEDGTVFTFKLRKEAKFSDGTPVTARDYEWTLKRNLDPASGSKYAHSLYPLKNALAFNKGQIQDRDAVGAKALDDYTLQLVTERPAPYLIPLIAATWTLYPLKREVVEKWGDKWTEADHIVTNGPLMVQSWKHDQEMVLVPNPHYWGEKPILQKVTLQLVRDPLSQALVSYESNELNFAVVPNADLDRMQKDAVKGKEVRLVDNAGTRWVAFDSGSPPFSDVRVRKAFYLAIDRPTLVNNVLKGVPIPAWTVLPPMIDGHNAAARIPGGPAEAKQLLAEAGYPEGRGFPEVELMLPQTAEYRAMAETLQPMWKEVLGVSTKITPMENAAFVNWRNSRKDQPYHAFLGGWSNDFNDPYNWHNFLFDSREDHHNLHWRNPAFDELITRASAEIDTAKRKQLHEQAEALLISEAPVAPVFFRRIPVAVKPNVDGLVFTAELGQLKLDWTRILAQ
jgi:oligopeptide transport system substrate-binding protein